MEINSFAVIKKYLMIRLHN